MTKSTQRLFLGLLTFCCTASAYGQEEEIEKTPYYININSRRVDEVYEVRDYLLSFEYNDRFGQWQNIAFGIYNWKRERVASMSLAKTYGVNYYNIRLDELFSGWVIGDLYVAELTDESGKRYQISLRPVERPLKTPPAVAILVNPLELQCDHVSPSNVEFVGDITGGKTPYRIQWVVLNNERTGLLYQPLEEIIRNDGSTSVITVDKSPDYHVLLEVKDACDNIVRRQVHMVCDAQTRKISTVFVEPLKVIPQPTEN